MLRISRVHPTLTSAVALDPVCPRSELTYRRYASTVAPTTPVPHKASAPVASVPTACQCWQCRIRARSKAFPLGTILATARRSASRRCASRCRLPGQRKESPLLAKLQTHEQEPHRRSGRPVDCPRHRVPLPGILSGGTVHGTGRQRTGKRRNPGVPSSPHRSSSRLAVLGKQRGLHERSETELRRRGTCRARLRAAPSWKTGFQAGNPLSGAGKGRYWDQSPMVQDRIPRPERDSAQHPVGSVARFRHPANRRSGCGPCARKRPESPEFPLLEGDHAKTTSSRRSSGQFSGQGPLQIRLYPTLQLLQVAIVHGWCYPLSEYRLLESRL